MNNVSKANNQDSKTETSHWPCPIKLNLFLHFIGQREDGYHLLQSYFQLLDFGDELVVTPTQDGKISFSCDQEFLNDENNLVVQAAHCLKKHALINKNHSQTTNLNKLGAKLYLIKRSPIGGGVGGGSSDCATALVALNYLWKTGLNQDKLALLGESLGADVPIFVKGESAFVEGIGEKITSYWLPEAYYLVIQPPCQVATSEIFSNPLLTRNSKAITIRDLETLRLPFEGFNSMQSIVCESNPQVSNALNWLKSHNLNARMTGSGSSLFAVFDNQEEAGRIAALSDPSWLTFVARGIAQSPLLSLVKENCAKQVTS